jgi:hypothetical protein
MQFLQLLKALDQESVPPALQDPSSAREEESRPSLLAGDFNADGVLDLGGSHAYAPYGQGELPHEPMGPQDYFRSGLSFGGIANSILMAVERDIRTAAFSVPGGGLTDILTRMDLHPVIDRIMHELVGPVLVGEPGADAEPQGRSQSGLKLSFIRRGKKDLLRGEETSESMWSSTLPVQIMDLAVPEDGSIRVTNLDNGEQVTVDREDLWADQAACMGKSVFEPGVDLTGRKGCFSRGIPSDKGDRILITALDPEGRAVDQIQTTAPEKGMGKGRNTPDFRFFISLGQIALEAADPINYARHWFLDPLGGTVRPEHPAKNVMIASVPGDMFVPINAQIALARAAGLLGSESAECDGQPRELVECGEGWEDISRDCDCINLHWMQHGAMIGQFVGDYDPDQPSFEGRFALDRLSDGVFMECDPTTVPLTDNRDKGAGYSYIRFPYSNDWVFHDYPEPVNRGMHWLMAAFHNPNIPVHWSTYYQSQMAEYLHTQGFADDPSPEPDCPCPIQADTCRHLP